MSTINNINQKTSIPLFSIIVAIPVFVGAVYWISGISYTANANEKQVAELKEQRKTDHELLVAISADVKLVKYKLNIKDE